MKKNLFISVALIVLAVLAGCTPQSNFPAYPVTATITQTGDFMKGQALDSSKFQVVVTYLDGSTKTLENVALSSEDYNAEKGVQGGEDVSITVGTDINGKNVVAKGSIANVYEVAYITATTSKTEFATGDAASSDFTVTAYYGNNQEVLSTAYYTVKVAEATDAKDAEDYAEATSVKGVATVTLDYKLGGKTATVDVTVSKDAEPVKSEEITKVNSIYTETGARTSNFVLPAFDYNGELPDANDAKSGIALNVDSEAKTGNVVYANTVDGIELSYVDQYGNALDTNYVVTNFSANNNSLSVGTPSGTGIYIVATWNGTPVAGKYQVPIAKTEIDFAYGGEGFVAGTALADVDLVAGDYKAALKVDGKYAGMLDVADGKLTITGTYAENKIPAAGSDTVTVEFSYKGITASTKVDSIAAPASVSAVSFSVADTYKAPANQYYNAVPTIAASDIEDFKVTMSDGSESKLTAADFTWALYAEATEEAKPIALTNGEIDLSTEDVLYVGATYQGKTYFSGVVGSEVRVKLDKAVPTTLSVKVVYKNAEDKVLTTPVVGSEIEYEVVLSNAQGAIDKAYTGYKAILDGNTKTLPTTVTATAATYTAYVEDNPSITANVQIAGGQSYIDTEGIEFKLKANTKVLVGTALDSRFVSTYYELDTDSYEAVKGVGADATITVGDLVVVNGKKVEDGKQTVPVKVSYLGSNGEVVNTTVEITVDGISYTSNVNNAKITMSDAGKKEIENGTMYYGVEYNFANIALDETSVTQVGDDANLKLAGYIKLDNIASGLNEKGEPISTPSTSGMISTNYATVKYSLIISYTNAQGAVDYTEIILAGSEAPKA